MANVVKWDSKGNPIKGAAGKIKHRLQKLNFKSIMKDAAPAIGYGLVGGVATGIGTGIVGLVPPLRRLAAQGGMTRAAVVTGTSLVVAGVGLMVLGRVTTPKRAIGAAPFVLGGAVLTSLAPQIALEVVSRIDALLQSIVMPGTAQPSGGMARRQSGVDIGGDLPRRGSALGPRRALTADEVRMNTSPGGAARNANGVDIGGDIPTRRGQSRAQRARF